MNHFRAAHLPIDEFGLPDKKPRQGAGTWIPNIKMIRPMRVLEISAGEAKTSREIYWRGFTLSAVRVPLG
jgi:hypothetical protein